MDNIPLGVVLAAGYVAMMKFLNSPWESMDVIQLILLWAILRTVSKK